MCVCVCVCVCEGKIDDCEVRNLFIFHNLSHGHPQKIVNNDGGGQKESFSAPWTLLMPTCIVHNQEYVTQNSKHGHYRGGSISITTALTLRYNSFRRS